MKLFYYLTTTPKPTSAETVVCPIAPQETPQQRDSFVIQPHLACRGKGGDRKINVVIRGQG